MGWGRLESLLALVVVACASSVRGESSRVADAIPDEVVELTHLNLNKTKEKAGHNILLFFHVKWCGLCREIIPNLGPVATTLAASNPPVTVGAVDSANAGRRLRDLYEIKGYPTVVFDGPGGTVEYSGPLHATAVVNWVLRRTGHLFQRVTSKDQLKEIRKFPLVLIIFPHDDSDDTDVSLAPLVDKYDDVVFARVPDADIQKSLHESSASAVFLRSFDGGVLPYLGSLDDVDALTTFVAMNRLPLINELTESLAAELLTGEKPGLLLVMQNSRDGKDMQQAVEDIAPKIYGKVLVIVVRTNTSLGRRLMEYLGIPLTPVPTIRYLEFPTGGASVKSFMPTPPYTADSLHTFIEEAEEGTIPETIKSEPRPSEQLGPVYVLVGETFRKVVMNKRKDVLVHFFAPWCGHCKKFDFVYRQVASRLSAVEHLLIAHIDATANDVSSAGTISSYPTIRLFPANDKENPVDFTADRTADDLLAFLQRHTSIPIHLEDL